MIYTVKTKSGLTGWRCRLQENYRSLSSFRSWNSTYGLAKRLGFKSAKAAWDSNPVIEGSVEPSDFRLAPASSKLWKGK